MSSQAFASPGARIGTGRSYAHIVWPSIVVGFILISVVVSFATLILSLRDPSFSVRQDYYAQALEWDAGQAQRAANTRLAWRIEPVVGAGLFRLRILDAVGSPIANAEVKARMFHHAASALATESTFTNLGAGEYRLDTPAPRGGLWTLELVVRSSGETFTSSVDVEIQPGAGR